MKAAYRTAAAGLLVALGLSLMPGGPARTRAADEPRVLKIAVVDSLTQGLPSAVVSVAMRPLRAYMEAQTGMSGEIVAGGAAVDLGKRLDDDTFQVGVFHGHEFAWAKKKYPRLEPIVVCRSGKVHNRAIQVVPARSKTEGYADLKGGTLAMPRENRAYCRLFAERRCVPPGVKLGDFYKQVTLPIECADALDNVARGKVDSAVVEAAAWEEYRQAKPAWAKYVRVLQQSEVFPCGVIACRRDYLTGRQFADLRAALVNAPNHPHGKQVMTNMRLTAFTAAPEDFPAILDACFKAYPPK